MAEHKQATQLHIEVVTPRSEVISEDVSSVTLPGLLGEFKVHPNHRPLLTSLRPGRFIVGGEDGPRTYYLAGGFAEILPDRIVLLADECIPEDAVDTHAAEQALAGAQQSLLERRLESIDELASDFLELDRARAQLLIGDQSERSH